MLGIINNFFFSNFKLFIIQSLNEITFLVLLSFLTGKLSFERILGDSQKKIWIS